MANSAAPVGAHTNLVSVVPVITTVVYESGDALGGSMTFADALRVRKVGPNTAVIVSATILDLRNAPGDSPIELWLFDAVFTATTDHDPFNPSDVDMAKCLGVIKFAASDYTDAANNAIATRSNIGLAVEGAADGQTSIFGQLVVRDTPLFDAIGDITVQIGFLQD